MSSFGFWRHDTMWHNLPKLAFPFTPPYTWPDSLANSNLISNSYQHISLTDAADSETNIYSTYAKGSCSYRVSHNFSPMLLLLYTEYVRAPFITKTLNSSIEVYIRFDKKINNKRKRKWKKYYSIKAFSIVYYSIV